VRGALSEAAALPACGIAGASAAADELLAGRGFEVAAAGTDAGIGAPGIE
jgi:hypothetical protein